MEYLVVMRVCQNEGERGAVGFFLSFFIGKWGKGERTVVGRAERRRVEFWSQDCAVGRYGILCSIQGGSG